MLTGSLNHPVIQYVEKKSQLRKAKKWLEEKEFEAITFYHLDPKKILKHFCKIVEPIEAGGGLIRNRDGLYFFIFRRSNWDLPKGKLDPGENYQEACIREVKEETGIDAKIITDLGFSYHTYTYRQGPALKITNWFLMETESDDYTLQAEEDIEHAQWIKLDKAISTLSPMYINIKDIVENTLKNGKLADK